MNQRKFLSLLLLTLMIQGALTAENASDNQTSSSNSTTCVIDYDCPHFPEEVCYHSVCEHKSVFPVLPLEFAGIYVIALLIAMSCMAGCGGGGVVVPLCMVFFKMDTKEAVGVSVFCIHLCSVLRFIYNYKAQHPEKNAVSLDYSSASIMLPTVLIGSLIGVNLNQFLPDIIIQILLTLLQGSFALQAGLKARSIYKKENLERKALEQTQQAPVTTERAIMNEEQVSPENDNNSNQGPSSEEDNASPKFDDMPLEEKDLDMEIKVEKELKLKDAKKYSSELPNEANFQATDIRFKEDQFQESEGSPQASSAEKLTKSEQMQLVKLLDRDRSHLLQWRRHLSCLVVLISLILVTLFRGGSKTVSIIGIDKCHAGDWCLLAAFVIIAFGVTLVSVLQSKQESTLKRKAGIQLAKSDLDYNTTTIIKICLIGLAGGTASGAFGLGGGTIYNPILLYLGLPPRVVSATSMYMIMYSTFSSSFVYLINGTVNVGYSCWIAFWCLVGTMTGLKLLDVVMKKHQRQSPLVMLLTLSLGLATILIPIFGGMRIKENKEDGQDIFQFKSLC